MKTLAFCIFLMLVAIVCLSMASVRAQVEGPGPYIDIDRNGFALAWEVRRGRELICRSPFVNTRQRRIECD